MGNLVLSWLAGHQQYFTGLVLGLILSNPITCATIAFNLALKIPGFGDYVAKNPDQIKGWFDGFDKGIDDCVTKYVASQRPPVVAAAPKPSALDRIAP